MTRNPRSRTTPRPPQVYGERIDDLLLSMGAICSGGELLPAGTDPGSDQGVLSLSLTLAPSTGGSVRRAMLRSQADILRRQADSVGGGAALPAACLHCRESEAMLAVAAELQQVARTVGMSGTTIAERALLLGQLRPAAPCRCCPEG